jgi:hypothetical protein
MKGFTDKTQKKLTKFTLDLLLPFYLNRYSGGVYNRPGARVSSAAHMIVGYFRGAEMKSGIGKKW